MASVLLLFLALRDGAVDRQDALILQLGPSDFGEIGGRVAPFW